MTNRVPLRVERVLRLLPDVDVLVPLRSSLIAASRRGLEMEPHLTVGKRELQPRELRALVPNALRGVTAHLSALFETAISAVEAEARGETDRCVEALLAAGDLERTMGRDVAARAWYQHALTIAEGERERWLEVEALQRLGTLESGRGASERAARLLQRALVLSEAEGDASRAAHAAVGLGDLALARENTRGASAWYARGFEHAGSMPTLRGRLALGMMAVQLTEGDVDKADGWVRQAVEAFRPAQDPSWNTEILLARARIANRRGKSLEALALFREALVPLTSPGRDARREVAVRMEIGALYLAMDRLPDAEDEIRRAEELAISHSLSHDLVRVYLLIGDVRARQRDESGFVFFEKAIELSRADDHAPSLEAAAYLAYARFRDVLGEGDEARAYLERAHEILESVDDPALRRAVDLALHRFAHA